MKKFILMAVSVSALCAGPIIAPLVDYDEQDTIQAEKNVEQKLILPPAEQPIVTTPGVRKKSFNYEADLLAGRNFADDDAVVKDATTVGIRLNRYITDTIAIQLGYDRIFDADYKRIQKNKNRHQHALRTGYEPVYCDPSDDRTPRIGLQHPFSDQCRNWLRHKSPKSCHLTDGVSFSLVFTETEVSL